MDKITKQELIDFLTENLSLELETSHHNTYHIDGTYFETTTKKIVLKLETTEISTIWFE